MSWWENEPQEISVEATGNAFGSSDKEMNCDFKYLQGLWQWNCCLFSLVVAHFAVIMED